MRNHVAKKMIEQGNVLLKSDIQTLLKFDKTKTRAMHYGSIKKERPLVSLDAGRIDVHLLTQMIGEIQISMPNTSFSSSDRAASGAKTLEVSWDTKRHERSVVLGRRPSQYEYFTYQMQFGRGPGRLWNGNVYYKEKIYTNVEWQNFTDSQRFR